MTQSKSAVDRAPAVSVSPPELFNDPAASARRVGLRYVSDEEPGFSRRRWGRGFAYFDEKGRHIRREETLRRIKSLVIPPAWEDVWICPDSEGHLQATGRDLKGRKQYMYHERWQEIRNAAKFSRMVDFCRALPAIRERLNDDLSKRGLPREKVLATIVRLLESTLIRIGNDAYAKENGSFGLTTLRDRHVEIGSTKVTFRFKGKSGREHEIDLRDRRLSRIVKRCKDVPGYELFQYYDEEGKRQTVRAGDVNEYLREVTGSDFSAKDFRTWAGTVLATLGFLECGPCPEDKELERNVAQTVKRVAEKLGNTPSTCRDYYIHPAIISGYERNELCEEIEAYLSDEKDAVPGLNPEEAAVLCYLEKPRS